MDVSGEWTMVAHMAVAALLGALIGVEREYRGYPAGVRTLALVCLGSALFTEMSWTFGPDADASRVAAGIVAGIGFLGAGVIVREGFTVKGITTAATIWTAASIGIAVAQGYFIVAVFVSLLIVALLELNPLTKHVLEAGRRARQGADPEISE
jgi:putative Mg2+ transporter-C (MgtC) family protein